MSFEQPFYVTICGRTKIYKEIQVLAHKSKQWREKMKT